MIYNEHVDAKVREYCKELGVNPDRPVMDPEKIRLIKQFIQYLVKKDKIKSREILEEREMRISCEPALRKTESVIEEILYKGMIEAGLDKYFIPQYEEPPYTMDFASPNHMVAVECDGYEFHHANQEQIDRDKKRDKFLASKGWKMIRIEGIAICRSLPYCIGRIKKILSRMAVAV